MDQLRNVAAQRHKLAILVVQPDVFLQGTLAEELQTVGFNYFDAPSNAAFTDFVKDGHVVRLAKSAMDGMCCVAPSHIRIYDPNLHMRNIDFAIVLAEPGQEDLAAQTAVLATTRNAGVFIAGENCQDIFTRAQTISAMHRSLPEGYIDTLESGDDDMHMIVGAVMGIIQVAEDMQSKGAQQLRQNRMN